MSRSRKIRMGMVGGCPGKFICDAHHYAWRLDGLIELVAGCFSHDAQRNQSAGETLGLAAERVYQDYPQMLEAEAALPETERIQLVASVTPNHLHAPVAMQAVDLGFPVISDKPLCFSLAEARDLCRAIDTSGQFFVLTHTYQGYPLVKQARDFVAAGKLGPIHKVLVEYPQAGVIKGLSSADPKRLEKLKNPAHQTDVSACLSDIGVHASILAESIAGLQIERVLGDTGCRVPGRSLDDDAHVLLRFNNGANGILMASQVCSGAENNLAVRVVGERGTIFWQQHDPNTLTVYWNDDPPQILRTGRWQGLPGQAPAHYQRMPAGHPEGYIEAFANAYRSAARIILARAEGREPDPLDADFPTHRDGFRGMALVQAVHDSVTNGNQWTQLEAYPEVS